MRTLVITYSNAKDGDKREANWERSMRKYGYEYVIVGKDLKWLNFIESKVYECYKYVQNAYESSEISTDDLVVFVDCFDVLACGPPEDLVGEYLKLDTPIIFGAENYCGKNCIPIDRYQHGYRYLNSGFYMGRVIDLLDMWSSMMAYPTKDDQIAACLYVRDNPDRTHIDLDSRLVANIHESSHRDFRISGDRVYRIDTQATPCFAHFPGYCGKLGIHIDTYGAHILGDAYQPHTRSDILQTIDRYIDTNLGIIGFFIMVGLLVFLLLLWFCLY